MTTGEKNFTLCGKTNVSRLGLGTWQVGISPDKRKSEEECFLTAITECGINLIDTAECYGDGKSEEFVGEIMKKVGRERVFLVDKLHPDGASVGRLRPAFEKSLKRLKTDYIDLYLLHWRGGDLRYVAEEMTRLGEEKRIGGWGVSNFDSEDLDDLFSAFPHAEVSANQFLYNPSARGAEFELAEKTRTLGAATMAYSPLGNGGEAGKRLAQAVEKALSGICDAHAALISFALRKTDAVIFKTASVSHLKENLLFDSVPSAALDVIDKLFPPPEIKTPLEKI